MNNVKIKNEYENNGFTVKPQLISAEEIREITNDLDDYLKTAHAEFQGREINYASKGVLNSIHNMNNWHWVKELQARSNLRQLAEAFLEDEPEDFGAELFAKPAKVGLKSPMHQDNFYWCIDDANALTIWIALDDADKENGGIFYFEGSNHLGNLEHTPSFAPGSSQTLKYPEGMNYFEKKYPTLKAGDCLVHNTLVVHGSNANVSDRNRRGLTIRYKSASSKIDAEAKKKYETALNLQVANRSSKKTN
jgi:phytanoyl-CoA hydroxylase